MVEYLPSKQAVASSSLVFRFFCFWRHGQVVRQRPAKPLSPVRIWVPPVFILFGKIFTPVCCFVIRDLFVGFVYFFMNEIIDFENIYVNYGPETVLKNINLKIKQNENWVLLGANGSGKTTLIKLFSQDIYPNTKYEFKKEIFGKERWDIFELKKYLGIVTNDLHNQFMTFGSYMSAYEVVLSGYDSSVAANNNFSASQHAKAMEVMDFLGLTEIKDKKAAHMSTGQLRRCIIARALIHSPKALVLDEPTSGLDIKAQSNFIKIMQKLSKEIPVILITHNIEEIFPEITHAALVFNQTIFCQGRKEEVLNSKNLSEIFDMKLDLKNEKGRFYIKSLE